MCSADAGEHIPKCSQTKDTVNSIMAALRLLPVPLNAGASGAAARETGFGTAGKAVA